MDKDARRLGDGLVRNYVLYNEIYFLYKTKDENGKISKEKRRFKTVYGEWKNKLT